MNLVDAKLLRDGEQQRADSTITEIPSSTLPNTTKATIEAAMNVKFPPGNPAITLDSCCEKPDWVSAHAIDVAAPRISRITPDSDAVSTSIGMMRVQSNWR